MDSFGGETLYREKGMAESDDEGHRILSLFPELSNGHRGMHDITVLQVLCAFAKSGVSPFLRNAIATRKDEISMSDRFGRTPLIYGVINGNKELVKLLLDAGAYTECSIRYDGLNSPIVNDDYKKWHKLYVQLPLPDNSKTLTFGRTPLHLATEGGHADIVNLLVEKGANVNATDDKGVTPLLLAGCNELDAFEHIESTGRKDCLKLLIENGADLTHPTNENRTVCHEIFRNTSKPIECFKAIFDCGIEKTEKWDKIVLNFRCLSPKGKREQIAVLNNIFNAADESEKLELLLHPLVESYLNIKWAKVRKFFYLLILSSVIFVTSLSVYVLFLLHKPPNLEIASVTIRYVLAISSAGLLVHAIIQGALMWKRLWKKFEIWMNLCCTSLALVVVTTESFARGGISNLMQNQQWVLHATSISVLLGWIQLMLLIGRFPNFGYYALMFGVVLQNVMKVLLTFMCLIIGFVLSFSIQFYNLDQFKNPWYAFVKTTVMMTGEMEYGDLFPDDNSPHLPVTSRVIFLLFIIVAGIVLMNLMIGLAVSDIQALQTEGTARRLEKQAEFLQQLEKVTFKLAIFKRFLPKFLVKLLSEPRSIKLELHLDPEWCEDKKKRRSYKSLSPRLLDSIASIANKRNESDNQHISRKDLIDLIKTLKMIGIDKPKCRHNAREFFVDKTSV